MGLAFHRVVYAIHDLLKFPLNVLRSIGLLAALPNYFLKLRGFVGGGSGGWLC